MSMNMTTNRTSHAAPKYVIAIDVGTSGTKVGLVGIDGRVVALASGRYESRFLPDGGVEQVPDEWWQVIDRSIKQVVRESAVSSKDIVAIGVTSQWSVTVPVDAQGEPLMNAISWMDSRGGKYNAKLVKGFPSLIGYDVRKLYKWINIVGYPPSFEGTDCLAHILYIKNERPEIYQRTYKFLEPMDFINMRLTGKACANQCSNIATLLIDNRMDGSKDYNPWALKLSGVDRSKLPDLSPVGSVVGNIKPEIAAEWGLTNSTVVVASATDNSVTPIGAGAVDDYEAVAVMGTSGMLVFHFPRKKSDLLLGMVTMPGAINGRYVFSADTGNTGAVVNAFLNNFIYGQDSFNDHEIPADMYDRLNQAVAQAPVGSEGVLFLPWFNSGALAPTNDRFLRGGFINLTNHTSRNHLARSMFEGIAFNWRWLRESAETFSKFKFPYWRITGGAAASDIWAQIMADVIGIPMHQQDNPGNASVLGMAFLAFHYLNLMPITDAPSKVITKHVFEPIPANQVVYDRLYSQFRQCYRQLKPVFHSLNKPN
jgi:xylulokinase